MRSKSRVKKKKKESCNEHQGVDLIVELIYISLSTTNHNIMNILYSTVKVLCTARQISIFPKK